MWLTVVTILIGLSVVFYLWVKKKMSYFRSKGVAEDPGFFPLGSNSSWGMLSGKLAFSLTTNDVYKSFPNEKIVGTYGAFGEPMLIIRDLEIAKLILIKDFDHFVDRRPLVLNKKANKYFTNMLTVMKGNKWKTMRSIVSPVFTSGKLRSMMPIIDRVGENFVEFLKTYASTNEEFEAKELMTSYTLDVILNAGFGVETNSFSDTDSELRNQVNKLLNVNQGFFATAKIVTIFILPTIAKMLNLPFLNEEASEFMANIIRSSVALRRKEGIRKNDLIDILIDALNDFQKSSNPTEVEDQFEKDAKINHKISSTVFSQEEIEEVLISNAFMLFFVGFDTSSTAMSLVTYFLAKNPDVQEKLYREIEDAISQNDDNQKLDYNIIQGLLYLEQVINESLRMYPATIIERVCVKDYKIPGLDFVVPKGMLVQISSPMIMKDEKYFTNPEDFNPNNFSPESKSERNPYAFLAFGQGPRNCIGMRYAMLQVKAAIVRLIANYKVLPCGKTVENLIPSPKSMSAQPIGGIWIKVEKR